MPNTKFDEQVSMLLGRPYSTKNPVDLTETKDGTRNHLTIPEMLENLMGENRALAECLVSMKKDFDHLKATESTAEEKAINIMASVGQNQNPATFQSHDASEKKTLTQRVLEARAQGRR